MNRASLNRASSTSTTGPIDEIRDLDFPTKPMDFWKLHV